MRDRVNEIQRDAPEVRRRPQPEDGPLSILFEDASVLVLDKPAGTVVHPTYKNASGTLLNAVLWRYRHRGTVQPGILTRLDKNTSGVVVVALAPELHARMQADMTAGRIEKEYLAVTTSAPSPPQGRISLPLGRSSEDRRIVVVRADGARCETEYELVEARANGAILRCRLLTGRTHQIRVHLAASGWPIVGDTVYGQPDARIGRQALHASRASFPHPITREPVTVTAPVPADIEALLE